MNASKFRIIDKTDIELILKQKIENNYIFNLKILEEHNTILFNTIIEIENEDNGCPFKYLVSLKYKPNENILQLVTMFLY